jgi:hypothetical protein
LIERVMEGMADRRFCDEVGQMIVPYEVEEK